MTDQSPLSSFSSSNIYFFLFKGAVQEFWIDRFQTYLRWVYYLNLGKWSARLSYFYLICPKILSYEDFDFMDKNCNFGMVWLISLSKIKFRMQKSQFFNNLLFLKRQNHRTTPFSSSTWFVLSILENGFLLTHPGLAPALANCRVDEYMINDLFFHPFEK